MPPDFLTLAAPSSELNSPSRSWRPEGLHHRLAAGTTRGWRPAPAGAAAGLATLAANMLSPGPPLDRIPVHALQPIAGLLLLPVGLG